MNITASGTANVDQATTIQGASNTGTSTISAITDSAENLAVHHCCCAIGTTVTASTAATAAWPTPLAFAKEVVYSEDTAEAIAGASDAVRNDAVNITASGTANVDQGQQFRVRRTLVHQRSVRSRTAPRTLLVPPMHSGDRHDRNRKHSSDGSSGHHDCVYEKLFTA